MKIIALFLVLFTFTGCYTVLWLPEDEMPKSYSQNEFYNSDFYGEYYDFYSTPWWVMNPINIYYPSKNISTKNERDSKSSNIRNESGERGINQRGGTGRSEYTPPVTTINGNNQGNNNSNSQTNNKTAETNTANEEQSRTKSNSNNDSGSIRNESGNRNSGNTRR